MSDEEVQRELRELLEGKERRAVVKALARLLTEEQRRRDQLDKLRSIKR